MTSLDGSTWTSRTSAADNDWRSVTYGNGLFVAVSSSGSGNRVMTSSDGTTWTSRTSAADNDWYGITYGNGLFVAVALTGSGNRVMTSPDGITWTSRTSAADNEWYSVTYGNGLFVAVAYSGTGNRVMTASYQAQTPPISNICFVGSTPITTNQGNIPIDKINPQIHTIRNKKILRITQTTTQDKYLVCFEKDSLAPNIPSQKTIISSFHCIYYQGKMMQARDFVGKYENVKNIRYRGEILYNVLMEDHEKMLVNNLICETLHPKNSIVKIYNILEKLKSNEQEIFIKANNKYVIDNKIFYNKVFKN